MSALCAKLPHLLLWANVALAHMEMSWPYALHSRYNPKNNYTVIDYSMTSPLSADGTNFPCKGYQNDRPFQSVITYVAGSTYNVSLSGSTTHGGGSCQISLSYDNGATFRVIKSMIGGCPLTKKYEFTIPSYVPKGDALLSWTWQNHAGNREFYQNCAQVTIENDPNQRRRRQSFKSFESLPYIWKANLEGVNGCVTTEGQDPDYPNAGPDVVYADSQSSYRIKGTETCDWPTPYGSTYKDLGDSTLPEQNAGYSSADSNHIVFNTSSNSVDTPNSSHRSTKASTSSEVRAESTNTQPASNTREAASQLPIRSASVTPSPTLVDVGPKKAIMAGPSTVTVTADCETTVTVTIGMMSSPMTMLTTTRAASATMPSATDAPAASRPDYAKGDINALYLPCVPGTFLCTSSTTLLTCDYNDGTVQSDQMWVYSTSEERSTAPGMECLPMLAPYTPSNSANAQQGSTTAGEYRDDRYVRAQPQGGCEVDGSLQCTSEGQQFSICDQRGWIPMGPVVAGTMCTSGAIVAISTY